MVNAYILVSADLMLTCGELVDRYGRKRRLLIGLGVVGFSFPVVACKEVVGEDPEGKAPSWCTVAGHELNRAACVCRENSNAKERIGAIEGKLARPNPLRTAAFQQVRVQRYRSHQQSHPPVTAGCRGLRGYVWWWSPRHHPHLQPSAGT